MLVDSVFCFEEKFKRRKLVLFIYDKNGEVEKSWIENIFILDSYNVIVLFLVNEIRLLDMEVCKCYMIYIKKFIYREKIIYI